MRSLLFASVVSIAVAVEGYGSSYGRGFGKRAPGPDAGGRYTLEAEGIKAQFIPYGATLTNLFVPDKNGVQRDIVLGYDNTSYYPIDPNHPVYNAIPGRYANRIGNGQFTLDNVTYHLEKNDGNNTLHGGTNNWSYRFWNVSSATNNSITFFIHDPANSTGMPGSVDANVTYSVEKSQWKIKMRAISPDVRTIIMLTQHTYFNLDAFSNPSTDLIWNHTIQLPYSPRYLEPDPNMLPTGKILTASGNTTNDFYSSPKQLGFADTSPDFVGNCGTGSNCSGYNNEWLIDEAPRSEPVVIMKSDWSGIKAELRTNQAGVQVYTCYWMDGSIPIKNTQGVEGSQGNGTVKSGGCVAIEAQDYVDGINHPEWGRIPYQVFGPGQVYEWESVWDFSS